MTILGIVSRAACRISAILFVAVMMTADPRGLEGIPGSRAIVASVTVHASSFECSEHSECGEDVYCINEECTTCLQDPDVCLESEFCQYPDECFCDETDGSCKEGIECLDEGYPQSGLGYCGACDDVWTLCPTWPQEYYCTQDNRCLEEGTPCSSSDDCPLGGQWVCTQSNECLQIG
jgi:hypothetical protein